jgi:NADPH:quinone reductase-like Zn-dependent oxidoreductase
MATQLAREAGAHVIGTGRAAGRQTARDFGAHEFVDLEHDALEDAGGVDLVFDVIGGDIQKRSAQRLRRTHNQILPSVSTLGPSIPRALQDGRSRHPDACARTEAGLGGLSCAGSGVRTGDPRVLLARGTTAPVGPAPSVAASRE